MPKPSFEILLSENEKIILARVLSKFDLPFKKYPDFGTWSYIINTDKGLIIFDVGPKYNSFLPILRSFAKKTNNAEIIINTVKKYFPGKPIREILISHYHFDHSEAAPELQQKANENFGFLPPIRIHKNDTESKRFVKIFKSGLSCVFKKAGCQNWKMGENLEDGENINGTNFTVSHAPGHTTGSVALVNEKKKIVICGWWTEGIKNLIVRNILEKLTEEDKKNISISIRKIRKLGYSFYFYHPECDL